MSMLEDLYSEDLIGDPETLAEGEEEGGPLFLEDEADEQSDNVENNIVAQTVPQGDNPVQPKKKRVIKNPQPKLDAERLKGPRGLSVLENVFRDYKFCGKGYEKQDVDQVMKRLEHWAHRLFPKYQFDDCLEKLETLGHKKPVMVYVKKIRMGLETVESSTIETFAENNEDDLLPIDPFDELLSQQLSEVHATICMSPQNNVTNSPQPPKVNLTEEQRKRMERNRLIAQERRLERLKALQEGHIEHQTNSTPEISVFTVSKDEENQMPESEGQHTSVIQTLSERCQENAVQSECESVIESVPLVADSNTDNVSESPGY